MAVRRLTETTILDSVNANSNNKYHTDSTEKSRPTHNSQKYTSENQYLSPHVYLNTAPASHGKTPETRKNINALNVPPGNPTDHNSKVTQYQTPNRYLPINKDPTTTIH